MTSDSRFSHSTIYLEHLPTAGVELIKQFSVCRLQAYPQIQHFETSDEPSHPELQGSTFHIGWGSTYHRDGLPISAGDRITQTQANELLHLQLLQQTLPILKDLPNWDELNENQQGALISLAHSLKNDLSVFSPRSLLGKALRHRRWYQIPAILSGYYGYNPPAHIAYRRQKEAELFLSPVDRDAYTVINCSRDLSLTHTPTIGDDVCNLQRALVLKGYEIDIDGVFGPLTQWATEKFQASIGFTVTGVADMPTQRVLHARELLLCSPPLIGSDVREIQSQLVRIGYSIEVTGVFNQKTEQAILAFQRFYDLPEDGIVKDRTLAKLLYLPVMVSAS